jgi:NTE family protein
MEGAMKLKEHIASIGAIGRMRIQMVRESWWRSARSASALLGAAAVAATAIGASGCGGGNEEARILAEAQQPRTVVASAGQPRVRVALVLSSGGLRGLAHLGVLRALEANGLTPDLVVGSSVGAIVAASYAAGLQGVQLLDRPLPGMLDPWGTWFVSPSQRSRSLEAFVADVVAGRRIEELPRRFVAVATERNTGCLVLFGAGDTARAVAASSALPGVLAPVSIGGRTYVDGGLGAPLPVRVARALGAERVIAVDTTFHAEPEVPPGLIDSVFHAGMVMSRHLALPDRDSADVLIEPRLPPVPEVTLANREQLVLAGERAALAQMDRLRRLFAEDTPVRRPGAPGPSGALPTCDETPGRWVGHSSFPQHADARPATAPTNPDLQQPLN